MMLGKSVFMGVVFGLVAFSASASASASAADGRTLVNCKVNQVFDDSFFEESLSAEEYPAVTVTEDLGDFVVMIGMSRFDTSKGDQIEPLPSVGFDRSFRIVPAGEEDEIQFVLVVRGAPGRPERPGTLIAKIANLSEPVTVATLTCR